MLQIPSVIQKGLPPEIDGMIKNASEWSKAYVPDMKDFLLNTTEKSSGALVGRIGYYDSKKNTYSTTREETRKLSMDKDLGIAFIEGSSVIKKDKFVGFLNGTETRGCLWIMNKVKDGAVTSTVGNNKIVMQIHSVNTNIIPHIVDNKIIMNVKLQVKAKLEEMTGDQDILNIAEVNTIEKLWENEIVSEMNLGFNKVQKEYGTDVFGFDDIIREKYPKYWKTIEPQWQNIFPTVEIKYDVTIIFRRIGKTTDSIFNTD
jgi:Ger(x)C family germination protein